MSSELKFYREMNEKLFMKIGYEAEPVSLSHTLNGQIRKLVLEDDAQVEMGLDENTILIEDKDAIWDVNEHDLNIHFKCYINNPQFLFGGNGVATDDAKVGFALRWHSKSSKQRGTEKVKVIDRSIEERCVLEHTLKFSEKKLYGELTVELVLYLEEPSSIVSPSYASNSGTVLGVLDFKNFVIDGQSSAFPIVEVHALEAPLWYVTFNYTDVMSDSFTEENIAINLNMAHKNYNIVSGKKEQMNNPVLTEIISSALHVIVEKVMKEDDSQNILSGNGFESGSIGEAIFYFITTFNWDISSPEKLAASIRNDWESRVGGEGF